MIVQILRQAGDQRLSFRLLAVADGMGGAERGEVASRLTMSTLATYASEHLGDVLGRHRRPHSVPPRRIRRRE